MKRELGIARCGLACCLCSENSTCPGCRGEGCKDKDFCENRRCSMEKGLQGCFECPDTACRKGLLVKSKPLGFTEYVRRFGTEQLLDRLEENEKAGAVYHRRGIFGDYDEFESVEEVISYIDILSKPFQFRDTSHLSDGEIMLRLKRATPADLKRCFLPAYHFDICLADGTPVGVCDLRIGHSRKLYIGGNIGYTVFPPYRGHHYARKACLLLFAFAKEHGLDYLIITCVPDNLPSRRTLEGLPGKMLEIADIPEDYEMYAEGKRQVCVFRYGLE